MLIFKTRIVMLKPFLYGSLFLTLPLYGTGSGQQEGPDLAQASSSFSPIDYPNEWNNYKNKDMFPLLDAQSTIQGYHQWMSAMYTCFSDFDKDEKYGAINYVRTLHTLATTVKKTPFEMRGALTPIVISFVNAWHDCAMQWLSYFNPQSLSNTVWSFATLGHKPSLEFLQALEDEGKAKIKTFTSQHLSNTIWSFATLGHKPSAEFLKALEEGIQAKIKTFNSQDLSNTIWSFATLGHKPSAEFLQALEDEGKAKIKTFNSQGLSNTIWSFATLGHKPADAFLQALEERIQAQINAFTSQGLTNTIWSFATLGHKPADAFLQALEERIQAQINAFNSQELANTIWSFATLGHKPSDAFLKNLEEKTQQLSSMFEPKQRHQLYIAYQYFERVCPVAISLDVFRNEYNPASDSENDVFTFLDNHEIKGITRSVFIDCIASKVDGFQKATNTIIYVDGPTHYMADGSLLLSDQLLDYIAMMNGYNVVRIKLPKGVITKTDLEIKKALIYLNNVQKNPISTPLASAQNDVSNETAIPAIAGVENKSISTKLQLPRWDKRRAPPNPVKRRLPPRLI
jgi:hypothetical protein